MAGLGIRIPLAKRAGYVKKRQLDVIDFAWLLKNKADVSRKFGGSINPSSSNYDPVLMTPAGTGGEDMSEGEAVVLEVVKTVTALVAPSLSSSATTTPASTPPTSPTPNSPSIAAFTPIPNSSSAAPLGTSTAQTTSAAVIPSTTSSPTTTSAISSSTTASVISSSTSVAVASSTGLGSRSARQRRQAAALSDQGTLWMSEMTIGGQNFQIDFDTGSSDLWVPHVQCSKDGCVGHKKYTVTKQARAKTGTFSISYGDGSKTSGPIYTDNAAIAGLSFANQTFSPATQMSQTFANDGNTGYPADGIAGMGFQSLSQMRAAPWFQNLYSQGKLPSNVFSFRLAHSDAELYIGGINPNHYSGSITYASVTKQAYWTINMDAVAVGSSVVNVQGKSAIIDSGTTLVYGSYDDIDLVFKSIPGSKDMSASYGSDYKGYHTFPCSSNPSVSLAFGGKYFTIGSKAFNLGKVASGSKDCVAAVVGQDPKGSGLGQTWLVGDAFLIGTYAIFDVGNSRVGFATPK